MNKSLLAIATATCALAAFTTTSAEAGFKIHFGFGGFGGFHHHHHHYRPLYVARPVQPRVYVARKAKPVIVKEEDPVTVADVHSENSSITVGPDQVASVENSSITSASEPVKITETAKTAEAAKAIEPVKVEKKVAEDKKDKPAVAQKLDCKKFFPSVGLTLTVPCE